MDNDKKKGILCFGELLLRFCPDTDGQWLQRNSMDCFVGGAEANVASALALWKAPVSYVTALPENVLSRQLALYLEQKNINTTNILYAGDKIGTYYLSKGKDLKNSSVIYDRAHSSFWYLDPESIDWDAAFKNISWFHFSAITPALNNNLVGVLRKALTVATQKQLTVSLDFNYRPSLWKYGKEPLDVMPELTEFCDVVMGNIWAYERMLGIKLPDDIVKQDKREIYLAQAKSTSEEIKRKYGRVKLVANTFRMERAEGGINYYSTLHSKNGFTASKPYEAEKILDKVGTGDCFMAGLIFGTQNNWDENDTLSFAATAAFEKFFIEGDTTTMDVDTIIKKTNAHGG